MIIQEIFAPPGHKYPPSTLKELRKSPDVGEVLGTGSFGSVYEDKTNPYNVIKIGVIEAADPTKDGYLSFLNNIKRLKIITFPRVDSIEIFKNLGMDTVFHPYIFKVRTEKLTPPTELSSSEIISLYERFFGREEPEDELLIHKEEQPINKIEIFLDHLRRYLRSSNLIKRHNIPDKNLRLALLSMKKTMRRFSLDLFGNNIMFRRTPYGIQPVFTDPFATLK